MASRIRGALRFAVAIGAMACGASDATGPSDTVASLTIISGNGQVGLVGQTLSLPLAVKAVSGAGTPFKGAVVKFAVTTGSATVSPASATTDSLGQATTNVTLGPVAGNVTITASASNNAFSVSFTVTAGSSSVTTACQRAGAQTPAVGAVLPRIGGNGICLGGGANTVGAEYALVAFYGDADSSKVASMSVTGHGTTGVATANLVPADASMSSLLAPPANPMQAQYDAIRRETARRELTPLMPAARAQRQLGAALARIPSSVTVGTLVTLNANSINACTNLQPRVSRVAAVSNTAIVIADTANPAGGFTDAEYQGFATLFDTLINPLDVANFGQGTDIDANGKVIIYFTKEVNAITPKTSSGGFVGGTFFERDLFPLTTQNGLAGCAGSNFAEMFYMLVPDPSGTYSIPHSKDYVSGVTPGTLAHEYQHLINASRRLYVNNANSFEDVWLNEGLSHIAEELAFYKVSGLSPRQNIGITQVTASTAVTNSFFQYFGGNLSRFEIFLGKPAQTSVYAGTDSLETRGAAWSLLRYLADQRNASDADTWQRLVNTTLTGKANLANVFGADYMTQIGNWAVSIFADDDAGVTDARFVQPSWNLRSIFPRVADMSGTAIGKYPLAVLPLSDGLPVTTTVFAGGTAYIRFSVSPGSQASIDWTSAGLPVSPLMQISVMRTK